MVFIRWGTLVINWLIKYLILRFAISELAKWLVSVATNMSEPSQVSRFSKGKKKKLRATDFIYLDAYYVAAYIC